MRVLVYAHRAHATHALALVGEIRASGVTALYRDIRGFDGQVEACDRVVTDDPRVAAAHEARGIEVEPFTKAVNLDVPDDIPAPAPAAEGGDPESTPVPQRRQRRKR